MNYYFIQAKQLTSLKHCIITILTFLLFSATVAAQTIPRVFINEVLASNLTTNPDMVDFGDFSDWIELYNDENVDVNIGGFYISDDFTIPTKWQFPANSIIPAKGFYLVWADDFNDVPGKTYIRNWWPNNISFTTKWCHANFKLNKGNRFTSPSWRYDFTAKNGGVQNKPSDIIMDMNIYMNNMLTFFEEVFMLCIQDNWDVRYNFQIYKRTENEINKKCPSVYFVSLELKQ